VVVGGSFTLPVKRPPVALGGLVGPTAGVVTLLPLSAIELSEPASLCKKRN